ncbi:MAG: nitroreductase/quinone reductase family protein [Ktedonobacteraceae bacterium]
MTKQFHPEVLAHLSPQEKVGIAIQMDGKVHRSTLQFVVHEGNLYIRSARKDNAPWYKNLRANANADLHIGRFHIPIHAVVVEDDETLMRVSEHYAQKYGYMLPVATRTMIHDDVIPTTLRIEPVEVESTSDNT